MKTNVLTLPLRHLEIYWKDIFNLRLCIGKKCDLALVDETAFLETCAVIYYDFPLSIFFVRAPLYAEGRARSSRLFNVFSCLVMENVKLGSNKQDSESLGLVGKILW